ncbi:MAG: DUF4296 domain-containing protein [Chitinophagaceae bacterium]
MRTALLFFFTLLIITGCKSKDSVPGDVLPPAKMQALLWDMMRADQFLTEYVLNKDTAKKKDEESIKLYEQILGFHQITKEEFQKSFDYYQFHPGQLKVILDSISKRKFEPPAMRLADSSDHVPSAPAGHPDSLPARKRLPPKVAE